VLQAGETTRSHRSEFGNDYIVYFQSVITQMLETDNAAPVPIERLGRGNRALTWSGTERRAMFYLRRGDKRISAAGLAKSYGGALELWQQLT
jgi:hypothetical protein